MQGKILKKILAAALVLTLVTGGVPISPVSDMFGGVGIVANAEAAQEQIVTYTIEREATGGRYIYYLVGSDGTSNILIDSKDASPTRVTIDMGDDVTFDVYAGGAIISCGGESKEKASIVGFNNYLNSSNLYITITSKTHAVRHIHVDGSGYKDFKVAKTSMEVEGKEQSLEVHWVKGSGGTRMGAPGKFVVTFTPPVKTYNINYNLNGGTNASSNPSTYDDDKGATLSNPTRTHYSFGGWYDNEGFSGDPITAIPVGSTGDVTLYAKWTINSYTVTWKNADGSTLKTDTVEYGKTPSYSGTPTKAGNAQYSYTFSGWSPAITSVTGNQTYTAQYSSTVNKYTVTWKNGDTTLETDTNVSYGATPTYNGATPTKAGNSKYTYAFNGWTPNVSAVTGDVEYSATFTVTPKSYTVTYKVDGETYGNVDTVAYGTALTAREAPTKTGYTFSGWSEIPATMPDENVVITGTFAQNNYNIAISDSIARGSVSSDKDTAHFDDKVTLTVVPENGYSVKSITAGSAEVTKNAEGTYSFTMPAENVTVNAEFVKKVSAKAATCTVNGNIEYYESSNGKLYTLKDGVYTEISENDTVIEATGHSYGEPVWTWAEDHSSASAKFTCTKSDNEETIEAVVTSETVAPTFEADGKIVYTAKTTINGTEYTDTKKVAIPKKVLVATVGDEKYDSLKAAVDAADGDEVVVVYANVNKPDVDLGYDTTYGCYNNDIEIDLNGHTVTFGTIATNNSLTVKNGTLNCEINNVSNYNAVLTLDNATLNTPEPEDEYSQGISWMAGRVDIKNGSTLVLKGNAYFGGWYDPFVLNIDETSSVIMNNVLLSGSNEEAVIAEFSKYLPDGYAFGYDDEAYSYRIKNAEGNVVTEAVTLGMPKKTDISSAKITLSDNSFEYDGNAKTVTYTVTLDGKTLVNGTDFTFEGDTTATDAGIYIVKVKGIGDYAGEAKTTWKIVPPAITVTINEKPITQAYDYNKSLTVTAPEAESGMKFSHWEVNGKAVSYSATYSFIVKESVDLVPVYVRDDDIVEQQAVLNLKTSQTTYNGKNAIKYTFTHSIPDGYTVKEVGLLYATNKLAGADTTKSGYATVNLVDNKDFGVADVESAVKNNTSGKVKKYVASYKKLNGTVTFSYALGANTTAYTYAVGYVKVEKDGIEQTLYTNFVATDYKSANN